MTDTGRFGVWQVEWNWSPELAREAESLGFGTLWIGGSRDSELTVAESLLEATARVVVATGIVNVWTTDADVIARAFHRLDERFPGRFLLGVGAGHRESQAAYAKPYTAVSEYLDRLDKHDVPSDRRVLAALGPRMLELSATRARGAHPYLTTPAHTASAREALGSGPLLAPEHKVVVDADSAVAREMGRAIVRDPYLERRNYVKNLLALGYTEQDVSDGGSDRLIDDLVSHGDDARIAAGVRAHHDAGADHVAIQLVTEKAPNPENPYQTLPATVEQFRSLARALDVDGGGV